MNAPGLIAGNGGRALIPKSAPTSAKKEYIMPAVFEAKRKSPFKERHT